MDISAFVNDFAPCVPKHDPKEIWKKVWHIEWFLFSFNKDPFGFVYHNWFPAGNWEAPEAEWDYTIEEGFHTYSKEYIYDNVRIDRHYAELELDRLQAAVKRGEQVDKSDIEEAKFIYNIVPVPYPVYSEIQIGYIENGKKYYFQREDRKMRKQLRAESRAFLKGERQIAKRNRK